MKKILFIIVSMAIFTNISAQKLVSGSLEPLKNETQINMTVDFSNSKIDKKPLKWAQAKYPEWDKGVQECIGRFNAGFMSKFDGADIGNYPNAKYTINYIVYNVDDDQDTKGDIQIINNEIKEEIAYIIKANGSAGTFGSFFNLLGDAFEDLGKKFGKMLRK